MTSNHIRVSQHESIVNRLKNNNEIELSEMINRYNVLRSIVKEVNGNGSDRNLHAIVYDDDSWCSEESSKSADLIDIEEPLRIQEVVIDEKELNIDSKSYNGITDRGISLSGFINNSESVEKL